MRPNIWIELYKGNAKIIGTLRQIGRTSIGISVITKAELLFGARDKKEFIAINRHLGQCQCFHLSSGVSSLFIELMRTYSLSHRPSIPDMLIAATAIDQGLELYTLNTKDFQFIEGLRLYQVAQ